MRKSVVGMIGIAVALMLAACGSVGGVASSIIRPCEATTYEDVLWSPDGKHIAFLASTHSTPTGNPMEVFVMNPDGSDIRELTTKAEHNSHDLRWLPDSLSLVYGKSHTSLFRVSLDGSRTEIGLPTSTFGNFRYSPDASMMAYNILFGDWTISGISLVTSDGSRQHVITDENATIEEWSPDGTHIAYIHVEGKHKYLYTMRADGSDQRRLAVGQGPVHWSPDGQWLSFISYRPDGIHIIRSDGTDDRYVTSDLGHYQHSWLPDSQHIAYVSFGPDYSLTVIDLDTRRVETLSSIKVSRNLAPAWSPDGTQVVVVGNEPAGPQSYLEDMYSIDRNASGEKRLTDNPGRYQCFNWPF